MNISSIVRTMEERIPWDVGRKILAVNQLPRGQGWEKTTAKLVAAAKDHRDMVETLGEAVKEHMFCGEKLVRFYELTKDQMTALRSAIVAAKPPDSEFAKAYPANITPYQVSKDYPQPHTLVSVEKNDDGVGCVFASTRAILLREPIDKQDLPDELAEQYDEIMGVKLIKHQAMDSVWVPHTGKLVDVRVDFPRGMHNDTGGVAHQVTNDVLAKIGGQLPANAINLFPLINAIYQSQNEGCVVELAFGTTTASLKHEKMRRAKSCLRKETYHKGGKAALNTPIEPYRLSVQWDLPMGGVAGTPELSFNGSARMAGSQNPTIYDAVVRKCMGFADYEHVRARVDSFLKVIEKRAAIKKS